MTDQTHDDEQQPQPAPLVEPDDDELADVPPAGGDGDVHDDDADDQAQASAQLTEREIEKRIGSLEKEATRHANRVAEIMGDDALQLQPCPRCAGPFVGFHFPGDHARMSDEQRNAVLESIGENVRVELDVAEDKQACEKCHGHGRTLTGSKVPDQMALPCAHCKGYGWTYHGAPQSNGATPAAAPVVDDRPPLADDRPTDADPWGRLPGDVNYGVLPQYAR